MKSIQPVDIDWWGVGAHVWSEIQIVCILSSWCHCHSKTPSSLVSCKSRLVLPFLWYWLTQVVLERRPLNGCSGRLQSAIAEVHYSLSYVATLPCSLLLMTCFADNNVSQGSVATYARFGGIADIHLTANLPRNLPVKNFFKSVKNWQNLVMSLWPRFLAHPVWLHVHFKRLMSTKLSNTNITSLQVLICRCTFNVYSFILLFFIFLVPCGR